MECLAAHCLVQIVRLIVYWKMVELDAANTSPRVANHVPWRANSLVTSAGDFVD